MPAERTVPGLVPAIVREVEIVGPDMAEVARRLGEPTERVKRAYSTHVVKNGFSVGARLDREALGLKTMTALVELAPGYAARANDLFAGMDDLWFLHNFVRTHPEGRFILQFTIPVERRREFPELLKRMKEVGLVTRVYKLLEFTRRVLHPMSAEYFDFKRGRWRFDWTDVPPVTPGPIPPATPKQRFDFDDLGVVFYLMISASTPIEEVAKLLHIEERSAREHAAHASQMHLTNGYVLNWPKEHWNPATGVPFSSAHKYVMNSVIVGRVTREETRWLRDKLNAIPFLWGEYVGRDYCAEVALPPEHLVEGMSYLRQALVPVRGKTSWHMMDPDYGYSFSPPRRAFNVTTGEWVFDLDDQMVRLQEQMRIVREEARSAKQAVGD